jgi:hypothetical protein
VELNVLSRNITEHAPTRVALVGSGGSGKSALACALGHRLSRRFQRRIHWFRVGAWSFGTLTEMLALGFGTSLDTRRRVTELRAFLRTEERLIVLDNHEDDRAMCQLLAALDGSRATIVITARRCLLSGVLIYPVIAPLVSSGRTAFPRVAELTTRLRYNPLALDIADGIVQSAAASGRELSDYLEREQVSRVRVIAHEDDLPEVALLVDWAWQRLSAVSRRMLTVLTHMEGDHMGRGSLSLLARAGRDTDRTLAELEAWRLIQEPSPGRYTVHAVVRYAVARKTKPAPARLFEHYIALLERRPELLVWEQTHLFAAMDYAHRTSNLEAMLRVERLLHELSQR